jgi:hypothetical protein
MSYSYLSEATKTWANDQFNNLHETFKRPITIWKTAEQIIIAQNPENNWMFASAPFNSETVVVQQSGVFGARILYGKKEALTPINSIQFRNTTEQNNLWLQEGEVRIRLDPTGTAFLQGAKKVTFDDTVFEIVTSKRPHGLFTPNFNDFTLRKVN